MIKIAYITSGNGEGLESLVKAFHNGNRARIALAMSNNADSGMFDIAKSEGIAIVGFPDIIWTENLDFEIEEMRRHGVELVVTDKFALPVNDHLREAFPVVESPAEGLPLRQILDAISELESAGAPDGGEKEEVEQSWAEVLGLDYEAGRAAEAQTPQEEIESASMSPAAAPSYPSAPYAPVQPPEAEQMPSTYLVWSILSVIFCCGIPGVVAIVYSTLVSSRFYAKDYEGSRRASELAQIWIIVSIVLGVVTSTIMLPLMLVGGS